MYYTRHTEKGAEHLFAPNSIFINALGSYKSSSLPHRQLRKATSSRSLKRMTFAAAQAAQKSSTLRSAALVSFAAAQAAQKEMCAMEAVAFMFAAAQAAQKK